MAVSPEPSTPRTSASASVEVTGPGYSGTVDEQPAESSNDGKPAGLEADGRDEKLTKGDLVHPSGTGPGGHTTPPGTALPDEPDTPPE